MFRCETYCRAAKVLTRRRSTVSSNAMEQTCDSASRTISTLTWSSITIVYMPRLRTIKCVYLRVYRFCAHMLTCIECSKNAVLEPIYIRSIYERERQRRDTTTSRMLEWSISTTLRFFDDCARGWCTKHPSDINIIPAPRSLAHIALLVRHRSQPTAHNQALMHIAFAAGALRPILSCWDILVLYRFE